MANFLSLKTDVVFMRIPMRLFLKMRKWKRLESWRTARRRAQIKEKKGFDTPAGDMFQNRRNEVRVDAALSVGGKSVTKVQDDAACPNGARALRGKRARF